MVYSCQHKAFKIPQKYASSFRSHKELDKSTAAKNGAASFLCVGLGQYVDHDCLLERDMSRGGKVLCICMLCQLVNTDPRTRNGYVIPFVERCQIQIHPIFLITFSKVRNILHQKASKAFASGMAWYVNFEILLSKQSHRKLLIAKVSQPQKVVAKTPATPVHLDFRLQWDAPSLVGLFCNKL